MLCNCGYRYFHPSQGSKQSIIIQRRSASSGHLHLSPQIQTLKRASRRASTPRSFTPLQAKSIANQPKFIIAICHPTHEHERLQVKESRTQVVLIPSQASKHDQSLISLDSPAASASPHTAIFHPTNECSLMQVKECLLHVLSPVARSKQAITIHRQSGSSRRRHL